MDVRKLLELLRIDGQDRYIVIDVGQAEKINSLLVEDSTYSLPIRVSAYIMYTAYLPESAMSCMTL